MTPGRIRLLGLSRALAYMGGGSGNVICLVTVYLATGSGFWIGAAALAEMLPGVLLAAVAGILADRWDRRVLMIAADVGHALCLLALIAGAPPAGIVLAMAVSGTFDVLFLPASVAYVGTAVDEKDLARANGFIVGGQNAGLLAGPALGGVAVAFLPLGWAFALSALLLIASAGLISLLPKTSTSAAEAGDEESEPARGGYGYLWRHRMLRMLVVCWLVLTIGIGMSIVAEVPLGLSLGLGDAGYGLLAAAWGAGAIVGSGLMRLRSESGQWSALCVGTGLVALGFGAAAISSGWAVIVLLFIAGSGDGFLSVAEQCLVQRVVPGPMLGRVAGVFEGTFNIGTICGLGVAGGLLSAQIGAATVFAVAGLLASLVALVLVLSRALVLRPA